MKLFRGDNLPANFKIMAGSNGKTGEGTTYAVSQIVRHPDFNEDNYDYSYSCIQVNGTFKWGDTIQLLLLPSADFSSGTYYTVAGWGAMVRTDLILVCSHGRGGLRRDVFKDTLPLPTVFTKTTFFCMGLCVRYFISRFCFVWTDMF